MKKEEERRSTPSRQKMIYRHGGPNKIWGPGIDLCTPWKIFSLRPCPIPPLNTPLILAIHFELLMQPIVLIGDVGTLLGYEFNNINDKTNNSIVKNDNWVLIQLGLLLLNSYPSNVPTCIRINW